MHHFQRCLVEGPPYFGDIEISSLSLVTISNSLFYLYINIDILVLLVFILIMFKWNAYQTCDIHRIVFEIHPYLYGFIIFCSHYCLTNMYILVQIARAFSLMIMFVYIFVLHILIACLDITFIKTCVYTCTTSEPHLIIICLCFIAHVYPLNVHV